MPRLGQTIQFQRRSAAAATEDMNELLARARGKLENTAIYGGCLCSCNGRGQGMFGRPTMMLSLCSSGSDRWGCRFLL